MTMIEQEFRKVYGLIPSSLFFELKRKQKLSNNWDSWLALAIKEKLDKEDILYA